MISQEKTEIYVEFNDIAEWQQFIKSNTYLKDKNFIDHIVSLVKNRGILDPLTDEVIPPKEVIIKGNNLRETIFARNLISRTRAVLLVLRKIFQRLKIAELARLKIYAPEAVTPFARYMRGFFPFFLGSEYGRDPEKYFPIPIEDLQSLSFNDESFDVIIVNDVFEHLPFLDKAFKETYRCLKFNGFLISTFPFAFNNKESIIKAYLNENSEIVYLCKPEYHGNPVEPAKGSLVFQVPGWDILERLTNSGFKYAKMVFIVSVNYGILSPLISGVFVCLAQK